jgi:hypothetical protein
MEPIAIQKKVGPSNAIIVTTAVWYLNAIRSVVLIISIAVSSLWFEPHNGKHA